MPRRDEGRNRRRRARALQGASWFDTIIANRLATPGENSLPRKNRKQ
jgi:hypothetical protein